MTTPADMPGAAESAEHLDHLAWLDELADDTLHVYRRFRRKFDVDTSLELTSITLNRKDLP